MLSCWTQISPNRVGLVSDSVSSSPLVVPLIRPERSGRPPMFVMPVTSVLVWSKVNVIGKNFPSPVVFPVQVPATSAFGASSAACRASQAALQPVRTTANKVKDKIAFAFVLIVTLLWTVRTIEETSALTGRGQKINHPGLQVVQRAGDLDSALGLQRGDDSTATVDP